VNVVSGNPAAQRAIWTGWIVFGWIALIVLAGLTSLVMLLKINHLIMPGSWHDLVATVFFFVAWPLVTLALRFCVKHRLWLLLGIAP
jgi:hypothetical protein